MPSGEFCANIEKNPNLGLEMLESDIEGSHTTKNTTSVELFVFSTDWFCKLILKFDVPFRSDLPFAEKNW
jgi:hypothetical protein